MLPSWVFIWTVVVLAVGFAIGYWTAKNSD